MRSLTDVAGLIGQILMIACAQIVLEVVIDKEQKPELVKMLSLACYFGALLLVLSFIFSRILPEINTLFRTSFY